MTYRRLLEVVSPKFVLGLSATPFREDRQDVASLCDGNIIVQHELRSGIESGILCPYHYFGCFDDVDYTRLNFNGGRYSVRDLERVLIIPERDRGIVAKWKEHAVGRPTLAFCCSHRHAERVAESFTKEGVPAEVYLSSTTREERRKLINRLQFGKLSVLCAVDVLNEGVDIPFIECLLMLRPTESKRVFYQQLGRGLRKSVGKSHCVAIDFIGNFKNAYRIVEYHGLLPSEREQPYAVSGRTYREVLRLPLGCEVHFDTRVIDLFASQSLDPRHATRQNIGRILLYQYEQLATRLKRVPTRVDVRRNCLLGMDLYKLVFGGLPDISGRPLPEAQHVSAAEQADEAVPPQGHRSIIGKPGTCGGPAG